MTDDLYCSINKWAIKQGYNDFNGYSAKHPYPTEDALTDMLEECTGLMNEEMGDLTTNITTERHLKFLRNLCYRMSNLMIDEEQGRAQEQRRSQFIPRDYMYTRDRSKLHRIAISEGSRVVGATG